MSIYKVGKNINVMYSDFYGKVPLLGYSYYFYGDESGIPEPQYNKSFYYVIVAILEKNYQSIAGNFFDPDFKFYNKVPKDKNHQRKLIEYIKQNDIILVANKLDIGSKQTKAIFQNIKKGYIEKYKLPSSTNVRNFVWLLSVGTGIIGMISFLWEKCLPVGAINFFYQQIELKVKERSVLEKNVTLHITQAISGMIKKLSVSNDITPEWEYKISSRPTLHKIESTYKPEMGLYLADQFSKLLGYSSRCDEIITELIENKNLKLFTMEHFLENKFSDYLNIEKK